MTYESTGEVRAPREGEFFLSDSDPSNQDISEVHHIMQTEPLESWGQRIILRPMGTPGEPRGFQVIVPTITRETADSFLAQIRSFGMVAFIEERY
jgi:hypothetical protein